MQSAQTMVHRATSIRAKAHRRAEILAEACRFLEDVGFDGFTMQALSKRLGLAKGTLYLYFETRETLLLALLDQKVQAWAQQLRQTIRAEVTTDEAWARSYYESVSRDPLFLQLVLRADLNLTSNVPTEALIAHKRLWADAMEWVAESTRLALSISAPKALEAVLATGFLLIGCGNQQQAYVFSQGNLPADVQAIITLFSPEKHFVSNVRRILAGIRAEPEEATI
ncbi:MAG: TetR/AcrR family transcriptional regulator [Pseudomonadales bacterium]